MCNRLNCLVQSKRFQTALAKVSSPRPPTHDRETVNGSDQPKTRSSCIKCPKNYYMGARYSSHGMGGDCKSSHRKLQRFLSAIGILCPLCVLGSGKSYLHHNSPQSPCPGLFWFIICAIIHGCPGLLSVQEYMAAALSDPFFPGKRDFHLLGFAFEPRLDHCP